VAGCTLSALVDAVVQLQFPLRSLLTARKMNDISHTHEKVAAWPTFGGASTSAHYCGPDHVPHRDKTVWIWEMRGPCRSLNEGHTSYVRAITFSPDGELVGSASEDKMLRVWEVATGSCTRILKSHTSYVSAIVFSLDNRLVASVSFDNTVRVWEVATGSCRSVPEGYTSSTNAIAFSPDEYLFRIDRGDITLPKTLALSSLVRTCQSSDIFIWDQWTFLNQERLLLLPSEYQPTCSIVYKDVVCLGHSSGQITLLRLYMSRT
jgi:WD40 repeat protein